MTAFWLNVVWMMAAQLYWEKDQGNLELYFAAPMNVMSVLFGMAVGGLVMSSHPGGGRPGRRHARLSASRFSVDQWGLLIAVFILTLAALYGLGMMLASLFLMWGREACHMTQLMQRAGLLRVRPELPGRPLGFLGALAIALIPLAVGLDAMRQLAFAATGPTGTPSPGGRRR